MDLKYDIYKQQVILYIKQNNSIVWLIPPKDFISAFSLSEKLFMKYTFQGVPRFYQVVFDNEELKCIYYWSKSRYNSDHKMGYNSSRFTDYERKTCLVMYDVLMKYSDNKSFVKLFPQQSQLQIKKYIKINKIKVHTFEVGPGSYIDFSCFSNLMRIIISTAWIKAWRECRKSWNFLQRAHEMGFSRNC